MDTLSKVMDDLEAKETVLNKIKKNIYQKITVTDKKSHIWQHFSEIRNSDNVFQKYLICKDCDSLFVYKCGRTGTSSLGRHTLVCQKRKDFSIYISHKKPKSPKGSTSQKPASLQNVSKNLLSDCISVCVKDIRPFELFEGDGMIQFSQSLIDIGAKYGKICSKDILPQSSVVAEHAKEMANNALPNVVDTISCLLRKGQHVAISADSWSDNHRRIFLSVSCHFINENWELKKVALGCTELMYQKTYINNELLDFLLTLGFEASVIKSNFTFLSTKNIAIDMESKDLMGQPCILHIINTILFHTFCETSDQPSDEIGEIYCELHDQEFSDNLQELFNSCINLITYIKTLDSSLTANLDIKSSWSSKYAMIMQLSKEETKIMACLQDLNEEYKLQNIDFTTINTISSFLEPFKLIIDALQGENNCTLYGILLFKMKLDNHLLLNFNDSAILKKLKKRAEVILKEKFTILLHHKIATFLCPKFRTLQFLSESERDATYVIIQQHLSELVSQEGDSIINKTIKSEIDEDRSETTYNSLLDFDEFSDNIYSTEHSGDTEFYSYLQASIQCEMSSTHIGGIDVLKFWKSKERAFPTLAKLAKSILCIPAYSMVSEKIFEMSNCQLEERRNSMNAENLGAIFILNTAEELVKINI